jgi:hypothetical protein
MYSSNDRAEPRRATGAQSETQRSSLGPLKVLNEIHVDPSAPALGTTSQGSDRTGVQLLVAFELLWPTAGDRLRTPTGAVFGQILASCQKASALDQGSRHI